MANNRINIFSDIASLPRFDLKVAFLFILSVLKPLDF
jgi:hypothetical protein